MLLWIHELLFADDLVHITADIEWVIRVRSSHHKQLLEVGWCLHNYGGTVQVNFGDNDDRTLTATNCQLHGC
jgi:hypothetical protein